VAWDRDFFYDTYPRIEGAFAQRLDESLSPRDPSVLLQVVRELDLRPDSRVVDVGCGEGAHAFRLATHFGLRVLGIDPVQRHLDLARAARRDLVPDIASRVSFERGTAEHVPVPDSSLDLVWCRDVMVHVWHPEDAYAEFARVLRPGGHVVAHQAVATDLLADEEADRLFDVRGVVPSSADPRVLDDAIARSGLEVVDTIDLSTEWGEWSQEQEGAGGRALLHLARLLREPDRYRDEFGGAAYDVMLADCRWHVHRMTGGLAGRLDVLRKG
jgi:SAM-dependent methyltransferase